MSIYSALVALFLTIALVHAIPTNIKSSVSVNELIRLRCSHNPDWETSFFFNGTVTAYLGQDTGPSAPSYTPASAIVPLFNAVGWNVAKCYKGKTGNWYLVGREAMWYININATQDNILYEWNNPLNKKTVKVAHVDNDPVMQTFSTRVPSYPVQVYGDQVILPSDVTFPLNYRNPIQTPRNPDFDEYSPQEYYKASELFKFISPTDEVFSNLDHTDSTIVSWTRTSLFLPWMKMGNTPGYLLYSFQGSKIPDWTHLPYKIKAEIEANLTHYKHAPQSKCYPLLPNNATGITSWSYFKENFAAIQAGEPTPLRTPRQYECDNADIYVPAPDTQCKAAASLVSAGSWQSNGETISQYNIVINNTGAKMVQTAKITLNFAGEVKNSWNIQATSTANVYDVNLYGNGIAAGATASGYGIQVTGSPTISVAVTCN